MIAGSHVMIIYPFKRVYNGTMPNINTLTAVHSTPPSDNAPLPRWAYRLLALLAAAIGLASSVVTAQFFILGLERVEPDSLARNALIAAGVLMIITELAGFGLAALLPKVQLRALRWRLIACGVLLLAFEATTIYVTQVTLVKSSEAVAGSVSTRIADLRASIDSRRAAAAGLRANGMRQSDSIHGWNRSAGAAALSQSLDAERQIEPLAYELARLQAGKSPTLTDVLGGDGMLAYSVSRALLISLMGLVMFGAAGSLLRSAGAVSPVLPTAPSYKVAGVAPKGAPTSTPYPSSKAFLAAGVPIAAMGIAPMAYAAPHVPVAQLAGVLAQVHLQGVLKQAHPAQPGVPEQAQSDAAKAHVAVLTQAQSQDNKSTEIPAKIKKARTITAVTDGDKKDTGTRGKASARYERVKAAVLAGHLKPSVRSVQAEEGGGTLVARRYLQQLAADGVIERSGQGWARSA
jgi:hypothetical protein